MNTLASALTYVGLMFFAGILVASIARVIKQFFQGV